MTKTRARMVIQPRSVRRLAVAKQHLAGTVAPNPGAAAILKIVKELGCVQIDPINVVAPSQFIVLWSRLGAFPRSELDTLLWKDRSLFEYWGHQASIVVTEDYSLHSGMMRRVPGMTPRGWSSNWERKVERWMVAHAAVREYVLAELQARGPLRSRQFDHPTWSKRKGSGWGSAGEVADMLDLLFLRGEIMVAGRLGTQRLWDLPERCLPSWVSKTERSPDEVEYEAVQRSLQALGVASASDIRYHFLRNRYPNLSRTLERLTEEAAIRPVRIAGAVEGPEMYIHANDLPLLEALDAGAWEPRTTLLSPFDNLICDRKRTERVFDFRFSFEGYVPKHKREYGPYALSILHGDRLIGRIDPLLDRKRGTLQVHAVHAEARAPRDRATARAIGASIDGLAKFLGATEVDYGNRVPSFWKSVLR